MNTLNPSSEAASAAPSGTAPRQAPIRVWDWPVRVFHWLAVACFAGAWLTAESESLHLLHITLGYTLGGLVGFRVLWGLVGSRSARFANFVRSPAAAWRYLRALAGPRPEHHSGHNPAGAWAILGLLALIAVTVGLGWATETERLPAWLDEAHETAANALMALVGLHLVGVLVGSWRHRENLPLAMLTGRKPGPPAEGLPRAHGALGALLLAAVLGFWAWQWHSAPQGRAAPGAALAAGAEPSAGPNPDNDADNDSDD